MQADVLWALDARDADSAHLLSLFDSDGEYTEDVLEAIESADGSSTLVLIDRVQVPTGWRGLGVGRLLVDRALDLVTQDNNAVVALQSYPYLDEPDPPQEALDRTDHVWESLGFVRIGSDVFARDQTLIHSYADQVQRRLGL
jgi:predicted GNAT superfamily acetyltransferase